jgi:hypothetical protein
MIQFITNMQIFFICKLLDYKIEEWRIFFKLSAIINIDA